MLYTAPQIGLLRYARYIFMLGVCSNVSVECSSRHVAILYDSCYQVTAVQYTCSDRSQKWHHDRPEAHRCGLLRKQFNLHEQMNHHS
jgi:hypothetical protein